MSTFADLYREKSGTEKLECDVPGPIPSDRTRMDPSQVAVIHDARIQALAHYLFLRSGTKQLRTVGFMPVDDSTSTAGLCLDVSRCLADQGGYDVALVDGGSEDLPLSEQLRLAPPTSDQTSWLIAPHLWVVTRKDWEEEGSVTATPREHNSRLCELNTEFDFSVVCCEPATSWDTAVARACEGIVLVLTANKTRRLVAAQIKDRLDDLHIPLLGSVLAERRFPVPPGLYKNL